MLATHRHALTLRRRAHRAGATVWDVLAATACTAIALSLVVPVLAGARGGSMVAASLDNLRALGTGHVLYAASSNGRQLTVVPDELGAYGDDAGAAFSAYQSKQQSLRGIILGWGPAGGGIVLFEYRPQSNIANARLLEPFVFNGTNFEVNGRFGAFRLANCRQFNQYVGSKFYNPVFYAPTDPVIDPLVDPLLQSPFEYEQLEPMKGINRSTPIWSSYIMSPAAMFDPSVLERRGPAPNQGGWRDPYSFADGFRSPSLFHAQYSNLKTLMIEHHWLQNAPADTCNPGIPNGPYFGCEPYYFNHSSESEPATVFYDGSTRLLPTDEAVASDLLLLNQTGGFDGTWSRDTPLGEDGYFSDLSADGVRVSHHILTADGILGRDTIFANGLAADAGAARAGNATDRSLRRTGHLGGHAPSAPGHTTAFDPLN
ncbi:MAG: hypothetical protein AB8G96_08030 [Phycisphaerales bacterium]